MANQILTDDKILKEALRILHEKIPFIGKINRGYDKSYSGTGATIGDSIRIKKPARFITRSGKNLDVQPFSETNTQLTLSNQVGVDIDFSSVDLTLAMNEFSMQVIEPAMAILASKIEETALTMVQGVAQSVTTTAFTFRDPATAKAVLTNQTTPMDNNLCMLVDPLMQVNLLDDTKGLFQDSSQIGMQYTEGYIGRTGGFTFVESSRIPRQTIVGTNAAVTATQDFTQAGVSLTVSALPADVEAGQVFTVAGVFEIHPETKQTYATLKKFVVSADVAATGTLLTYNALQDFTNTDNVGAGLLNSRLTARGLEIGAPTYAVPGSIVTDAEKFQAAHANQSTLTANTLAVTFLADTSGAQVQSQSIAFHKDAFTIGFADLVLPKGTHMASRQVYEGVSMRLIQDYDINTDSYPLRFDILFGYQILRQEYACRITEGS